MLVKTMSRNISRRSLLFSAATSFNLRAQPKRQPNILLINTDDQRFDTIRELGNKEIHTPNLDKLVRRGFTFSNAYCQGGNLGAVCMPSRTQLMTGLSTFKAPKPSDRGGNYPLLAKVMEKAGYSTFHIGKRGNTFLPASEAFQETIFSEKLTDERELQCQRHADEVLAHIRSLKPQEPYFIYLAPPVPHDPRVAPKKFMDMYDPAKITMPKNFMPEHPFDNGDLKIRDEMLAPFPRTPEVMKRHLADYYACITCLDFHLGRIFDGIDAGNTIVIFTSDQGLAVGGRHGLMGKQNLYEHFKSPMIIAGPGVPHGHSNALTYLYDLFPTLCDFANAPTPAEVDGASMVPIVKGQKKQQRDTLFAVYKDFQRMVRDERWKLIWYPKISRFQLFDLKSDPWELKDHSISNFPQLARMRKKMAEQQEKFSDQLPKCG